MASNTPPTDRSSKVQSILDFATHLTQWISNQPQRQTSGTSQPSPFPDSALYFASVPLSRSDVLPRERVDLDQTGVHLWNACCRSSGSKGGEVEKQKVHIAKAGQKTFQNGARAAKECLATGDLQVGAKIIERLAERQSQIQDWVADSNEGAKLTVNEMRLELLLLQLTMAWKRDRLDMAEHFFKLLPSTISDVDDWSQFKAADILYEMGQQLLLDRQHELAVKWLARACLMIKQTQDSCALMNTCDLRLNVRHTYVRALLAMNDPESVVEAARVLDTLKSEFGQKLAVILLEIEILTRDPSPNVDACHDEILKIIRTVHLIDGNHNLIMHYVHYLKTLSRAHALKALKQYILQRLAPDESTQRTENAILTFIWMAVSDLPIEGVPAELDADLNLFQQIWNRILSPDAAHAAFLLLWKQIGKSDQVHDQRSLVAWCELALNTLLENTGDQNIGKVQRKLVLYYMKRPDLQAANHRLAKMNQTIRQQPLSLYLAYSVALRCHNEAAAEVALSSIVKLRDNENKFLMACVGETLKYGDQRQGAKLLQRVLDKFNYDPPPEIDFCALLRCTARLLISVISQEPNPDLEMLSRLCSIFRVAANLPSKCNAESNGVETSFSLEECRWFERTSFNLALESLGKWPAKYVIDLMEYSSQMHHPQELENGSLRERKLKHYINTSFIQALLYTTEARRVDSTWTTEDLPRTSYSSKRCPVKGALRYHLYQKAFTKYDLIHQVMEGTVDNCNPLQSQDVLNEIRSKVVHLLPLAFEALLFMAATDSTTKSSLNSVGLGKIVAQASALDPPAKTFALLADLTLSSVMGKVSDGRDPNLNLSVSTAIEMLSRIIDAIRCQSEYDAVRASRWIRCVVQMVLDHDADSDTKVGKYDGRESSMQVVESVVDEALSLARDAGKDGKADAYPSDELHWLSTTLFNLAVDYYAVKKESEVRKWAGKAVEVADALGRNPTKDGGDEGALAGMLRERCRTMGWS